MMTRNCRRPSTWQCHGSQASKMLQNEQTGLDPLVQSCSEGRADVGKKLNASSCTDPCERQMLWCWECGCRFMMSVNDREKRRKGKDGGKDRSREGEVKAKT